MTRTKHEHYPFAKSRRGSLLGMISLVIVQHCAARRLAVKVTSLFCRHPSRLNGSIASRFH